MSKAPSGAGRVQVQFRDARQQREAAIAGIWLFLATEVMFFGGAIAAFVIYWYLYPAAWVHFSKQLNVTLGTINTAVLLTSSLLVALAVRAAEELQVRRVQVLFGLSSALGVLFLAIKGYEWYEEYRHGFFPGSWQQGGDMANQGDLYFRLYFALTGLHAVHVLIGVALLAVLAILTRRKSYVGESSTPVEVVGLYWHFVDLVWVFLFPLLYLVERSA